MLCKGGKIFWSNWYLILFKIQTTPKTEIPFLLSEALLHTRLTMARHLALAAGRRPRLSPPLSPPTLHLDTCES